LIFFKKKFGSVSEIWNQKNPNRTEPVQLKGYYKYKKKCSLIFLTLTRPAVLSKQAAPSTLAPSTLTLSHISSHSQVSNKIKLIRLHLRSPDFSHISLPHRHDTHHADTPNLQSPNLANQSPPSLTPDLESCHNSHQVWFFFSVNLCFFFNICSVIFLFVGISLQKISVWASSRILVDLGFWEYA
jgi:hypothetical protein